MITHVHKRGKKIANTYEHEKLMFIPHVVMGGRETTQYLCGTGLIKKILTRKSSGGHQAKRRKEEKT
jgi:hypothetical protein